MWAVNFAANLADIRHHSWEYWNPATYLETAWGFFKELEPGLGDAEMLVAETEAELKGLLESKYPAPAGCTRMGGGDGTVHRISNTNVPGYYICRYPVFIGARWEDAVEAAARVGKILVREKIVPKGCMPTGCQATSVFDGVYGCERSRAHGFVFLWHNPARALRLLKIRAKIDAGLWKRKKPAEDLYRVFTRCLDRVVMAYRQAPSFPRYVSDVLIFDAPGVRVMTSRAKGKEDPIPCLRWMENARKVFQILDPNASQRLGRAAWKRWGDEKGMSYRAAIQRLLQDEKGFRELVGKYFKVNSGVWSRFYCWLREEEKHLAGESGRKSSR